MIIVDLNTGTYHNKEHLDERCNTDDIKDKAEYEPAELDLSEALLPTEPKWFGNKLMKPCHWCIGGGK